MTKNFFKLFSITFLLFFSIACSSVDPEKIKEIGTRTYKFIDEDNLYSSIKETLLDEAFQIYKFDRENGKVISIYGKKKLYFFSLFNRRVDYIININKKENEYQINLTIKNYDMQKASGRYIVNEYILEGDTSLYNSFYEKLNEKLKIKNKKIVKDKEKYIPIIEKYINDNKFENININKEDMIFNFETDYISVRQFLVMIKKKETYTITLINENDKIIPIVNYSIIKVYDGYTIDIKTYRNNDMEKDLLKLFENIK